MKRKLSKKITGDIDAQDEGFDRDSHQESLFDEFLHLDYSRKKTE